MFYKNSICVGDAV